MPVEGSPTAVLYNLEGSWVLSVHSASSAAKHLVAEQLPIRAADFHVSGFVVNTLVEFDSFPYLSAFPAI